MEIRFARKEDLQSIVGLCKEHAQFEETRFKEESKLQLLNKYLFDEPSGLNCLVLEDDNKLLGYATYIKQFSTWDAAYYVYLDCLFLNESIRGGGIGKQIMNRIKEYAVSEACSIVQWQTPSLNEKAISFYRKFGARSVSKQRFVWEF